MKTAMVLQKKVQRGKLQEKRAREYHHLLLKIGVLSDGNMDNPSLIAGILRADFNSNQRYLQIVIAYEFRLVS